MYIAVASKNGIESKVILYTDGLANKGISTVDKGNSKLFKSLKIQDSLKFIPKNME